ncbi:hypothetical protein PLANPX_2423 [Lacipirellula parvula]|uniref:Uncharacterized protein n=1 Tax=Lacipirellula parvula TaxID=2650471 RepID=A0A5K7XDB1_9BACT|nr:hypothetical protein PLANPX_2423 [Lacipirellula parvula]
MWPWSKRNSASECAATIRARLEAMPSVVPPSPWLQVQRMTIGGLYGVGFGENSDDLLVVSSQGRGLFNCLSGERTARDDDTTYINPDSTGMTEPGIGSWSSLQIPIAGIHGGGLGARTTDGWSLDVVQLPWPFHVIFLTSNSKDFLDTTASVSKICVTDTYEFRAAGFSPTGRSLIIAQSGELIIFSRAKG